MDKIAIVVACLAFVLEMISLVTIIGLTRQNDKKLKLQKIIQDVTGVVAIIGFLATVVFIATKYPESDYFTRLIVVAILISQLTCIFYGYFLQGIKPVHVSNAKKHEEEAIKTNAKVDVKQHIPGYVSGIEPVYLRDVKIESVLEIEFIKKWSEGEDFIKFMMSIDRPDSKCSHLMAEIKNAERVGGKAYWVVAYISPAAEIKKLNLPEWNPNDYFKQ